MVHVGMGGGPKRPSDWGVDLDVSDLSLPDTRGQQPTRRRSLEGCRSPPSPWPLSTLLQLAYRGGKSTPAGLRPGPGFPDAVEAKSNRSGIHWVFDDRFASYWQPFPASKKLLRSTTLLHPSSLHPLWCVKLQSASPSSPHRKTRGCVSMSPRPLIIPHKNSQLPARTPQRGRGGRSERRYRTSP